MHAGHIIQSSSLLKCEELGEEFQLINGECIDTEEAGQECPSGNRNDETGRCEIRPGNRFGNA